MDYLLALAVAVITASAIMMGTFLGRYRHLVKEADSSTRLAKDVWDTANSRFSVVDARIIDLMARIEVLASRSELPSPTSPLVTSSPKSPPKSQELSRQISQPTSQPTPAVTIMTVSTPAASQMVEAPAAEPLQRQGTETEVRVLRFLLDGSKSSAKIKDELKVSREHTARLMKGLFDRGLVVRNDRNKPYVYEITESGKSYVSS